MRNKNSPHYIAREGESLYLIARSQGLDVKTLAALNPEIKNVAADIGGQMVLMPQGTCPNGFLYTIQAGDTFFTLAQRFGTTVQAIQQANPGANPNNLRIGQVICIPSAQPPSCPNGFLYTIRAGDTFFTLAQRFGTTVQAIQQANPGVNPNNLQIGQQICIPQGQAPSCPNGFLYIIQAGDTFFTLAQRFGTTVQAIQQANPGVNPNNLQIGQQICIPQGQAPSCPNGFLYTIQAGDTFFLLAQRFGTTVQAIQQANPGVNPNNLQIGQQICIPN
ncbi:MAG: LysM peptidoglycan-binding domain-containing protein [Bacillota bacterium]|jgi:peptidoglycan endopeptidase LytF